MEAPSEGKKTRFISHFNRGSIVLVPGVVAVNDTEKSKEKKTRKTAWKLWR